MFFSVESAVLAEFQRLDFSRLCNNDPLLLPVHQETVPGCPPTQNPELLLLHFSLFGLNVHRKRGAPSRSTSRTYTESTMWFTKTPDPSREAALCRCEYGLWSSAVRFTDQVSPRQSSADEGGEGDERQVSGVNHQCVSSVTVSMSACCFTDYRVDHVRIKISLCLIPLYEGFWADFAFCLVFRHFLWLKTYKRNMKKLTLVWAESAQKEKQTSEISCQ